MPGGGGASERSRANSASVSQRAGSPHTPMATWPPGRQTLASSRTASAGSVAYWIALKAVTMSKLSSS